MFLLVFLRYLLGVLPGCTAAGKLPQARRASFSWRWLVARFRAALPQEWMSMDDALTRSFREWDCAHALGPPRALDSANHLLRSVSLLIRRIACWGESYQVLPARVGLPANAALCRAVWVAARASR
jgi:hypothetical protein